uniref:Ferritin n=1 Tax=Capra hircus TaxID=9925 RepID=A0A452ECA2_CAPHI
LTTTHPDCLPATSMSYYFDCDDMALKNFLKYFLHQSCDEREHDTKELDLDDWEDGQNAMKCVLHLEKSVNQSLLELHKLATDRNDPHLCDFIGTHYLNEQVKSNKELSDHATNLCKTGYLFDKHILGNRDNESLALC